MKFKTKDPYAWNTWFAWYPVYDYRTYTWLWLEKVERRIVQIYSHERGSIEYREVTNEIT